MGNLKPQIRHALNNAFDDVELDALCFDYFPSIKDKKFSVGMRKDKKISLLLEHCRRSSTGFSSLLDAVRQEYSLSGGKRDELTPLIEVLEAYLNSLPKGTLESTILMALYEHSEGESGSSKMGFSQLYKAINVSLRDSKKIAEVRYQFFSLQSKKLIQYQSLADGSGGIAEITAEGILVAKDVKDRGQMENSAQKDALTRQGVGSAERREDAQDEEDERVEPKPPPTTLGEIIQREPDCASVIQRHALAQEIIHCFEKKVNHFVVLHGQPMVGKTKLLIHISEVLDGKYAPLMLTGQGMQLSNILHDFDAFMFEFADQLTTQFGKWTERHDLKFLERPRAKGFRKKGKAAFETQWKLLRDIAKPRQPLIIVDEVERLLDFPAIDPRIVTFLDYFVTNPDNGCFILAGSEQIQFSENKSFSMLIAKGRVFPVKHYDDTIILALFTNLKGYFTYEAQVLRRCLALCDGHPRILFMLIDYTLSLVNEVASKQSIGKRDFERLLTRVLERLNEFLWALGKRLSKPEIFAIQLMTHKISGSIDKPPEIYLHELVTLAEHQFPNKNSERLILKGVVDLAQREWLEWEDWEEKLFRFKLGIFILWIHRYQISFDEVIP